jgi:hypothetical protein
MKRRGKIILGVVLSLLLLIGGIGWYIIANIEYDQPLTDAELLEEIVGDLYEDPLTGRLPDDYDPSTDVPTITMLTEFPDGETSEAIIDVEFIITPSKAAYITEVYCLINGNIKSFIYSFAEDDEIKLSETKLWLTDGENEIVFYAVDSRNKTVEYRVENKPFVIEPERPRYDESKLRPSTMYGEGVQYVSDWIIISFELGTSEEAVQEVADSVEGEIVGKGSFDKYYVRVGEHAEEELEAMCIRLEKEYEIVSYAKVNRIVDSELTYASANYPWWEDVPSRKSDPTLVHQIAQIT